MTAAPRNTPTAISKVKREGRLCDWFSLISVTIVSQVRVLTDVIAVVSVPRSSQMNMRAIVPTDGTRLPNFMKRRLRHVAVFWVAHGPVDTCPSEMGVPEVKYNSSRAVINGLSADGVGDHDSN